MTIQIKKYNEINSHNRLCPECNGSIIHYGHETICENCGIVLSSLKLTNSYQFNEITNSDFSAGDQYVSVGKRIDNVCTLGSHIGYYSNKCFYDYKNQIIQSKLQKKFHKLKKYYSLPLKIKNHETDYRILKILNDVSKYMQLTETIKNRAAYFYQTVKKKAKKITNHVTLIAFCIFYASREYHYQSPISIRELCEVFVSMGHRINPKLIIRDSLEYKQFLNKKSQPHSFTDFINKFINKVINSPQIHQRMNKKSSNWTINQYRQYLTKTAQFVSNILNKRNFGSRNPFILASAIVYCSDKLLARKMNTKPILTQKSASIAMDIPEYSIRDHYVKVLKPMFNL